MADSQLRNLHWPPEEWTKSLIRKKRLSLNGTHRKRHHADSGGGIRSCFAAELPFSRPIAELPLQQAAHSIEVVSKREQAPSQSSNLQENTGSRRTETIPAILPLQGSQSRF